MKISKQLKIINSYFVSSVSITLVLLTLGLFALLLLNTGDLSKNVKENVVVSIVLEPDAGDADVQELLQNIKIQDYVRSVQLVTPDEALEDLKVWLDDDITEVMDFNPLPTLINISPTEKYSNTDSLQLLSIQLSDNEFVADVVYNKNLVHQLDSNVQKITIAVFFLEFLLLIMAFSLINNTIRLLVHSKRFEIKTMQLVGATSFFIIKPFMQKSLLHGLFSSLIAIAIMIATILFYQNNTDDIIIISHLEVVFVIILLTGIILTSISTYVSVNKYIHTNAEDLY